MDLERAYEHCRRVTRTRAANFYFGIRLLPPDKYLALCAVYAFARRIDDIGDDGDLPPSEQKVRLEAAREWLNRRLADPDDPVLAALADSMRRYPIPPDALHDLIDGVEMDVAGSHFETIDETVLYCRRVAGSVGRLCLGVFGADDMPAADRYADALGVALQLTNILRDILEDRGMGRVYLPAEDIRRFRCAPDLSGPADGLRRLVAFEAARAEDWFADGLRLLPMLDRRSAACTGAMAGIYHRVLGRVRADPASVLRGRVSLPTREKTWVAVRSLLRASP